MTTALQDSFTDTNGTALTSHTMTVGPGWTAVRGTFQIQSNQCAVNSNADDDSSISDAGQGDVTLTSNATAFGSGANTSLADLIFRYQDSNNYWLAIFAVADLSLALYSRIAGTYSVVATGTIAGLSGTEYLRQVDTLGTSIKISFNGVPNVISYTSSTFQSATKYGIRLSKGGSPASNGTWNDFLVTYTGASGRVVKFAGEWGGFASPGGGFAG